MRSNECGNCTSSPVRKRKGGEAVPISRTVLRKCMICGKEYPVRAGDVVKLGDLLPYVCGKCAGKNAAIKLQKD